MGDKVVLTVEERKVLGKKVSQLRKQGLVPGVMYGQGVEPTPVMAPANIVAKVWRDAGRRQPVELTIGGKKRLTMIKSAEFDPVKHVMRHLSFQVVNQNEVVQTEVPVRIEHEGETAAERAGLVVLQAVETVEIEARPGDLPEAVIVPSDKLVAEGNTVAVADITPIEGVTVLTDPEIVVASVYEPSAIAAQNDAAAGTATDEAEVEAENGAAPAEEPGDEAKATEATDKN